MIQASEDIGNADPQALLIAEAAFKSAEVIGYPECRINLAQAAIYNALAPKSNACEAAIDAALADVRSSGLSGRCLRICAIGAAPDPIHTAPTCIRMITRRDGSSNATCPRASSAARSGIPPAGAGRSGGTSSPLATVRDGLPTPPIRNSSRLF